MRLWKIGSVIKNNKNELASAPTAIALTVAVVLIFLSPNAGFSLDAANQADEKADSTGQDESQRNMAQDLGVSVCEARAFPGYNLISPNGKTTYLFDNAGRVVNSWTSKYGGHCVAYLLENGHLFRTATPDKPQTGFRGPAIGGRFQEFDWDGNLAWDFEYHSEKRLPHHDAIRLPNGNALLVCWEMIDEKEAIAQGRLVESVEGSHLQPDCLVEIKPTGLTTGEIVWEWRSWDHLIQDLDRNKPNFGKVADHPERIDLNYIRRRGDTIEKNPDWMHVNAVAYNADLDQIVVSSPNFSEIWIIDHGTTTEEARGHTGGRWGKGGDLLYRWGNPTTYCAGTKIDQRLFGQHNIQWIPQGLPGEGNLLVFNNGGGREPEEHSSVDELEPPVDKAGNYIRRNHAPFGPDSPVWSYSAPNKKDFYSWFISGAQRLPNGNTLICSGAVGIVFEVTPEKEIVWKFANPFKNEPPPANAAQRRFQVLPNQVRGPLGINDDQRKQFDAIDDELNAKFDEILNAEQKRILTEPNDVDLGKVPAGEYLTAIKNDKLNLSEAQTETLQAIAQDVNAKITKILTEDQKRTIADYKRRIATARGQRRRPPTNTLFRAKRYGLNHPAFAGRTLIPGKTLVEIQQEREDLAASKN